jgi:hypothetical protein
MGEYRTVWKDNNFGHSRESVYGKFCPPEANTTVFPDLPSVSSVRSRVREILFQDPGSSTVDT